MSELQGIARITFHEGKLEEFIDSKQRHIARDKDGKLVFMAESKGWLQMVQDNFPEIQFHFTSEFKD